MKIDIYLGQRKACWDKKPYENIDLVILACYKKEREYYICHFCGLYHLTTKWKSHWKQRVFKNKTVMLCFDNGFRKIIQI